MRQLTDHIVDGDSLNHQLFIHVVDEPGDGGACHRYVIGDTEERIPKVAIDFQNGPIAQVGVNGLTQEALLAIVIDRLRGFQSGPFSTRENIVALTKCEEALMWLQRRTRDRIRRGVEGTHQK